MELTLDKIKENRLEKLIEEYNSIGCNLKKFKKEYDEFEKIDSKIEIEGINENMHVYGNAIKYYLIQQVEYSIVEDIENKEIKAFEVETYIFEIPITVFRKCKTLEEYKQEASEWVTDSHGNCAVYELFEI